MTIQTQRLELALLTTHQLKLWFEDIAALENELNCTYKAEPLEGVFLDIIKNQYEVTKNDPDNYLYHSFFFIIRKIDRIVVGSADFKNVPNEKGEVEIGYGLGAEYEHNGYMTEAVKAMCAFALAREDISAIIAETEVDNVASQRVLQRCGFKKYKQNETMWWRL